MFKTICLLVLAEMFIGPVRSWDIAVTTDNHIHLYSNNIKIHSKDVQFKDVSALAYDAIHNTLLFTGTQNHSSYIYSYDIITNNVTRRRSNDDNMRGLAYDPVNEILFWANLKEKSLYSISIKDGLSSKEDNLHGERIIKMDDQLATTTAIAVDSCSGTGYIYWANIFIPSIERSHFNGKERQTIINKDIHMPLGLAIDQMSKKIYWTDRKEGIYYSIESADLHGEHRTILFNGTYQEPSTLTISMDAIYWVDTLNNAIWKLPKNPPKGNKPTKYIEFRNENPFGIAIAAADQQIGSLYNCKKFNKVAVKKSKNEIILQNSSKDESEFCVHGRKVKGILKCICTVGYTGDRCSVTVCYNYCLQGNCTISAEGHPKCRCMYGFTGTRCNINICQVYCLNQGTCLLDKQNEPFCQCITGYEGSRCETLCMVSTTSIATSRADESGVRDCNNNLTYYELLPRASDLSEVTEYEDDMTIILSMPQAVSSKRPVITRGMSFASSKILFSVVMWSTVLFSLLTFLLLLFTRLSRRVITSVI